MTTRFTLIVSVAMITALPVNAKADIQVYIWFESHLPAPVDFVLDGKYFCSAPAMKSVIPYTCDFDSDCHAMANYQTDYTCTPANINSSPHTIDVSWKGHRISQQVRVFYKPGGSSGQEAYTNICYVHTDSAEQTLVLECKDETSN